MVAHGCECCGHKQWCFSDRPFLNCELPRLQVIAVGNDMPRHPTGCSYCCTVSYKAHAVHGSIMTLTSHPLLVLAGPYGWYAVWNTSATGYVAPKRLELILFNVPRQKWVYWTSCWPAGGLRCTPRCLLLQLLSGSCTVCCALQPYVLRCSRQRHIPPSKGLLPVTVTVGPATVQCMQHRVCRLY